MNNLERFVLGTVQLGMPYGISNISGQPSFEESRAILSEVRRSGIRSLDTADAYGQSSDVLGTLGVSDLQVYSKFIFDEKERSIGKLVAKSLERLKLNHLHAYSFHRFRDYCAFENWREAEELKEKGLFKYLGISLYSNEEIERVIKDPHINLIQLPFNLLDNWSIRGELIEKAVDAGKIVHVRSVYLQGLFLKDLLTLPHFLEDLRPSLQRIRSIAMEAKMSISELCIGYVLNKSLIKGLVVGLESVEQLKNNVKIFQSAGLDNNVEQEIERIIVPEISLLNPGNWK